MSNPINSVNKSSSGLCPHGMAPGACPICSGMGGGSTRVGERPQKAGEMSYHECAMIGAMIKARADAIKVHEQNLKHRADALKTFEQNMEKFGMKLAEFAAQISKIALLKPMAFLINNIALPIINLVQNIPNIAQNIMSKISQLKIDIQDKLNAIFGEAKAFVEKKMSELVSSIKSKFEGLFKIFKKNNADDDDTKVDEDKKIFNLKTILQKIKRKIYGDDRETESEQ